MLLQNKKQLFVRQYGHGIGDVLKNIANNKFVQSGFKSLLKGGKYLLTNLITNLVKNPEKIGNIEC